MKLGLAGVVLLCACGGSKDKPKPIDAGIDAVKACTLTLAGAVTADQTIARGCTASVTADVVVERGTLTIEAGASLEFADGRSLSVGGAGDAAKLVVTGTVGDPVRFRAAASKVAGGWGHVRLHAGAAGSTLTGLVIEHAGKDGQAALIVDAADVSVTDTAITDVAGGGVELAAGVKLAAFTGNKIDRTAKAAVRATPEGLGSLGDDNSFSKEQVIAVVPGTLSRSVSWRDHGAPYLVTDEVQIQHSGTRVTLTLEAGVEVRFGVKAALWVGKSHAGGLRIAGTDGAPVTLTSAEDKPAAWNLWIGPKGEALIEHAVVRHGGHNSDRGAIAVKGGALEVYRSTFRDNVVGLSVDAKGKIAVDGCTFETNSMFAISVFTQLGSLAKNSYDDASTIELRGGAISDSTTWRPQASTWWSGKVVVDKGTLTIEAGTEFTMLDGKASLHVTSKNPAQKKGKGPKHKAALKLLGLPDRPIKFVGVRTTPGTWGNIVLSGDQASVIQNVAIVGSGGAAAIVVRDYARATIENVSCEHCAGAVVTNTCDAQVTVDGLAPDAGTPAGHAAPTCAGAP
jgi:lipopolysaccharide export system protein LptA